MKQHLPMKADAALNVGTVLRDGVRLSTAEVVSMLYEACRQLDGVARGLPGTPDAFWITDAGTVTVTPSVPVAAPRSAVASLLEVLLPTSSDEPAYQVPTSLRTLPDRLRASGDSTAGDYKDLISILARYLPAESRLLLQQFVRRHTANASDDLVSMVTPPAVTSTRQITAVQDSVAPVPQITTPPAAPRVKGSKWPLALAALLLMLASGYLGFLYSLSSDPPDTVHAVTTSEGSALSGPASITPRVTEKTPPPSETSSPAVGAVAAYPLLLSAPDGAFSPSFGAGNTLLFHTGRAESGRIRAVVLAEDGRPSKTASVFDDGARNYHPRLSPDGRLLAFDSDGDGQRGVYISQPGGADRRRVSGDGYGAVPSWSPDGTKLTFIKAEPARERVWNLWMLDVASGDLQRLSSFRNGQVWGASWFPKGTEISYSHEDRLIVADLTTGASKDYQSPLPGRLVRTPAVSPDGRRIIFQVFRDGVWVLNVDTGNITRVLDDPTAEEFAWHPGGRQVAYHSRRDGQWRIWLMTI